MAPSINYRLQSYYSRLVLLERKRLSYYHIVEVAICGRTETEADTKLEGGIRHMHKGGNRDRRDVLGPRILDIDESPFQPRAGCSSSIPVSIN